MKRPGVLAVGHRCRPGLGETSSCVGFRGEAMNKTAPTRFEMVMPDFWCDRQ